MKKIIIILSIIFSLFLVYCFYPVITYKADFSKLPWRIVIYDRNWELITDKSKKNWYFKNIFIPISSLSTIPASPSVISANSPSVIPAKAGIYKKSVYSNKNTIKNSKFIKSLLKIEDKNFYNHYWVDILSKLRAIKNNLFAGKILGWASTITEQFIKNKYFKTSKRSFLQKGREAVLALYFSIFYDKDYVLENYLNTIYFWNKIYGIGWAIETYFWKESLDDLTDEEITILISLLHTPSISSLKEKVFLDYFGKTKQRLWFNFEKNIFKLNKKQNIDKFPFITNIVLKKNNNKKEIIIYSSIDAKLQKFAKDTLNQTLDELKNKNVTNGAILAIKPKTMEVLIYQASKNFKAKDIDSQVDIIKSKRQPWSTLKPFLYLLALESWANPDDLIIDIESEYNSFKKWKVYISENYSLREYWIVRLKKAIWNSLNNASVRLAKELWLQKVWQFYKKYWLKLDFEAEHYGYSLVLWNPDITLENLVLSYINLLPDFKVDNTRKLSFTSSVISTNEAINQNKTDTNKFLLYNILKDPDNRDISFGVNSILNTSIYQAVKTWTSSDFRDNLIVSYNKDFVIWIWIWNNDNSSMVWVTGITGAGYIWHQIIEKAIKLWYIKDNNYFVPKDIKETSYCLDKKCFRKELIFQKKWKKYYSKIRDNYYDKRDLFENLSDYEKEKLEQMWFELR